MKIFSQMITLESYRLPKRWAGCACRLRAVGCTTTHKPWSPTSTALNSALPGLRTFYPHATAAGIDFTCFTIWSLDLSHTIPAACQLGWLILPLFWVIVSLAPEEHKMKLQRHLCKTISRSYCFSFQSFLLTRPLPFFQSSLTLHALQQFCLCIPEKYLFFFCNSLTLLIQVQAVCHHG